MLVSLLLFLTFFEVALRNVLIVWDLSKMFLLFLLLLLLPPFLPLFSPLVSFLYTRFCFIFTVFPFHTSFYQPQSLSFPFSISCLFLQSALCFSFLHAPYPPFLTFICLGLLLSNDRIPRINNHHLPRVFAILFSFLFPFNYFCPPTPSFLCRIMFYSFSSTTQSFFVTSAVEYFSPFSSSACLAPPD